MSATEQPETTRGRSTRMLDGIETLGNKVPHPAIMFVGLCALVIVLSAVLALFDVSVTYEVAEPEPVAVEETYVGGSQAPSVYVPAEGYYGDDVEIHTETTEIESLISIDGLRFIFTSFVANFAGFSVVAVIFVAMIGVGVAEQAGMMAALIRKLVKVAPARAMTFILVLLGVVSSVASDAGYLILIPLGAATFLSLGRHPLAGVAATFAGVSAGFGVNLMITPSDSLLTEVTNESIALVDPSMSIDILANLYFAIGSTIFIAIVMTIITERIIEPRLGPYRPAAADTDGEDAEAGGAGAPAATGDEVRGLRYALYGLAGSALAIVLLTAPPGAPLRDPETDAIIGNTPFMTSLIFLITLVFLVAGICYGVGAGTIENSVDVVNAVTKTFASLAGLIFMLLIISQFIAYFAFSNIPTVLAVKLADVLESIDIGSVWLLIGFILVIAVINVIIPNLVPKWAIFAPIFIPLFLRLDVAPQTVLAAYRVGDSPSNVITPLMVYLPFIVVIAQRYRRDAGIGTVVALMLPYTLILQLAWLVFFVLWFLVGIPMGPGAPVDL